MSVYKIQTPGNYPEESIQHSEHGESLKSRIHCIFFITGRLLWNVMAHAQKADFVFQRNRRVHLNQRGRQFCR